jgi:exosortase/archaeosortase family protein
LSSRGEWTRCCAAGWPLAAILVAGWPLLPWYGARVAEEPWHLAPLAGATALLWSRRSRATLGRPPLVATLAVAAYAVSHPFLPPLLRATVLAVAVTAAAGPAFFGRALQPGFGALLLLALPALPSSRMVLGYPLRAASGALAAGLLRIGGAPATREGVVLRVGDELYSIDAPCSGIAMSWTALAIVAWLAARADASMLRTLGAALLALALVLVGNALRTAALVRLDASRLEVPGWSHEAVGLAAFALCVAAIVATVGRTMETHACSAR